jgi:hypothetical protein
MYSSYFVDVSYIYTELFLKDVHVHSSNFEPVKRRRDFNQR